jgi:AcrR family transcriptional regulator
MTGRTRLTREVILKEAKDIVTRQGLGALTFQSLAERLDVSKQAIIYWFPSKWELSRDIALPEIQREADTVIAAVRDAGSAPEAIERFLRALVGHYLAELDTFRMLYLAPQFDRRAATADHDELLASFHRTTTTIYGALESKIAADPGFRPGQSPRRLAVAAHMAGIGLLTMLALTDAMSDPMAHPTEALLDSLVALLTDRTAPS